jgi:hypothetical protein
MRRTKNMIEHDIWVAAFTRALARKNPNRARKIASDAVNMYRSWRRSISLQGDNALHDERAQIEADFQEWVEKDLASRESA